MQIRKIHDEHSQFQTSGQPHLNPSPEALGKRTSATQNAANAGILQESSGSDEITSLIAELRQLSENDEATVQLAQERFRSGELLTREAAEFVATSLLNDFNF